MLLLGVILDIEQRLCRIKFLLGSYGVSLVMSLDFSKRQGLIVPQPVRDLKAIWNLEVLILDRIPTDLAACLTPG